jgi:hypothetical protein
VESEAIPRGSGRKPGKIANLAVAALIAIIAGADGFLFSTNPLVFVPVGLFVGIVFFETNDKIKLLIFGTLEGVAIGFLLVFISNAERSLLIWIGVSISTFIAMSLVLHPRFRRRFTWKALFSVGLASVCFMATLVVLAMFFYPIFFLQISGVQASLIAANSPNGRMSLLSYTSQINDSASELTYLQLLNWTRRHMTSGTATSQINPIEILKMGRGACEDYAWVYVGLLVANNYTARLILDCSYSLWPIKEAGNHSWVEVLINGTWVPIDPSLDPSYGVNNPYLYARGWNKTINHIYAVAENEILDVTSSYIPPT